MKPWILISHIQKMNFVKKVFPIPSLSSFSSLAKHYTHNRKGWVSGVGGDWRNEAENWSRASGSPSYQPQALRHTAIGSQRDTAECYLRSKGKQSRGHEIKETKVLSLYFITSNLGKYTLFPDFVKWSVSVANGAFAFFISFFLSVFSGLM